MEKDTSFEPFAEEFLLRTGEIIWCTATTVDAQGRPRSRILHPIWQVIDGLPVGWVVTSQTPVKTTHLARNPHLACMYWNPHQNTVAIDCVAAWANELEKVHVWDLFMTTPPPLGYDLSWGTTLAGMPTRRGVTRSLTRSAWIPGASRSCGPSKWRHSTSRHAPGAGRPRADPRSWCCQVRHSLLL